MDIDCYSGTVDDVDARLGVEQDRCVIFQRDSGHKHITCGVEGAGNTLKCLSRRVEDGLIFCEGSEVYALEWASRGTVTFLMARPTFDVRGCGRSYSFRGNFEDAATLAF